MSESPAWYDRQQDRAKPISGETLERFGKEAAQMYLRGGASSIKEAIVDRIKSAGLAPEQVRRVVEFANTEAYLEEFKKGGSDHRIIEFAEGPASPSDVLQDLNDGGGGSVTDTGELDYQAPPQRKKQSAAEMDAKLAAAFGTTSERNYPEVNPYGEMYYLREKLSAAYQKVSSDLSDMEIVYHDIRDDLYQHIKQAMHAGTTLGQVLSAWQPVTTDTVYVQAAFDSVLPRLTKEGMGSTADLYKSLEKTASVGVVNTEHPLVRTFCAFQESLFKIAQLRQQQGNIGAALNKVAGATAQVLSQAAHNAPAAVHAAENPGLIRSITRAAESASKPAGSATRGAAEFILGKGEGAEALGNIAEGTVKHLPHMGAAYLAYRAAESPLGRRIQQSVLGPPQDPYANAYYGM